MDSDPTRARLIAALTGLMDDADVDDYGKAFAALKAALTKGEDCYDPELRYAFAGLEARIDQRSARRFRRARG